LTEITAHGNDIRSNAEVFKGTHNGTMCNCTLTRVLLSQFSSSAEAPVANPANQAPLKLDADKLTATLRNLHVIDAWRISRTLQQRKQLLRGKKPVDALDAKLARDYLQAQTRAEERHAQHALVCSCIFDDKLPISAKRVDIAALISQHQVVVLCGETGSGKTTQLPKICLELGRGKRGLIGCTQPRRIAARSLSTRLSQELGAYGQQSTAFKIRFNDRTDANTLVKIACCCQKFIPIRSC
jgi:HrpA-like RNA helicase